MIIAAETRWELQQAWPLPAWVLVVLFFAIASLMIWTLSRQQIPWPQMLTLSGLRLSGLALIFLMLGGWRLASFETELPDLLLLVDDSLSMQLPTGDSASDAQTDRVTRAQELLAAPDWLSSLQDRYRLQMYTIGDRVQPLGESTQLEAVGVTSRLGDGLLQLANAQRGRSTAAMVLLSDGIVTDGASLRDAADRLASQNIPLWTIGLGGKQPPPELTIDEVVAEEHAFLGDQVPVRVLLHAAAPAGREVSIELRDRDSDALLDRQVVRIDASPSRATVPLSFTADRPGVWNLEVIVPPLAGEVFTGNNRKSLQIVVRDEPIRVLLIAQQPSYEFRFLKHLLERATGQGVASETLIRLTSVLQDGDPRYADQDRAAEQLPPVQPEVLDALDVVILCDANTDQLGELMLQQIDRLVRAQGTGLVVIAGPTNQLKVPGKSVLADLLPIDADKRQPPVDLQTRPLPLALTRLGQAARELPLPAGLAWPDLPPIYWLLGANELKPTAQVILATRPGVLPGDPKPVIVTQNVGVGQVWLQLSDESFRWLAASAEHNLHERYWLQVVRQLARRKQPQSIARAKLRISGSRFTVGQAVEIELTLPESNRPRLARVAINRDGDAARLETLLPTDNPQRMRGVVDDLPAGEYTIRLVDPVLEPSPDPLQLRIEAPATEFVDGQAALLALDEASRISGGRMLNVQQAAESLLQLLPTGRELRLRELPSRPIWNHWAVATMVVGLLSAEWILRRRWGLA